MTVIKNHAKIHNHINHDNSHNAHHKNLNKNHNNHNYNYNHKNHRYFDSTIIIKFKIKIIIEPQYSL